MGRWDPTIQSPSLVCYVWSTVGHLPSLGFHILLILCQACPLGTVCWIGMRAHWKRGLGLPSAACVVSGSWKDCEPECVNNALVIYPIKPLLLDSVYS